MMNTSAIVLLICQAAILAAAFLKVRQALRWFVVIQVIGALLNVGIVAANIFSPSLFYTLSGGTASMNPSAILVRDVLTIGGLLLFAVGYFVEAIELRKISDARPEPK